MFSMGAKLDQEVWESSKSKLKEKENLEILPKNQHQLVFTFEKRRGKPVTLVGKFQVTKEEKQNILKFLKKQLGTGGTINNDWIEIQGEKKNNIIKLLKEQGWRFKNKNN